MAAMKKTEEYGFLKEVDSIALQQSLRHLDMAFQNFFKQLKTGFPTNHESLSQPIMKIGY